MYMISPSWQCDNWSTVTICRTLV